MKLGKRFILTAAIACLMGWPISSMAAKASGPTFGGGIVFHYQNTINDSTSGHRGGTAGMSYFILNVKGTVPTGPTDSISYAGEYRWLGAGANWMHYGWGEYNFAGNQHLTLGYFQVPFGNLPYGYDSFYCPLQWYTGLTDNQAMGIGYRYEQGPVRFDLDFFKNDNAGQTSTYAPTTTGSDPFQAQNTGNIRVAYTFNQGSPNNVTLSVSGRGGAFYSNGGQTLVSGGTVSKNNATGSRWAATVNLDGNWGPWNVFLGAADYAYSVPKFAGVTSVDRGTIEAQDFGYAEYFPSAGQVFSASLTRSYNVCLGPITSISPYIDWSYVRANGNVDYVGSEGTRVKNEQMLIPGLAWVAGPLYVWTEWLIGKNTGNTAFVGTDNGKWHSALYVAMGYYF